MTRRQVRFRDLYTNDGFTYKESLAYSWIDKRREKDARGRRVATDYEWFSRMKETRRAMYQKLVVKGVRKKGVKGLVRISRAAFFARIEASYRAKGWMTVDWRGKAVINPWKLLQHYRDEWVENVPFPYQSPSQVTHANFQSFVRALEKSMLKA